MKTMPSTGTLWQWRSSARSTTRIRLHPSGTPTPSAVQIGRTTKHAIWIDYWYIISHHVSFKSRRSGMRPTACWLIVSCNRLCMNYLQDLSLPAVPDVEDVRIAARQVHQMVALGFQSSRRRAKVPCRQGDCSWGRPCRFVQRDQWASPDIWWYKINLIQTPKRSTSFYRGVRRKLRMRLDLLSIPQSGGENVKTCP